MSQPRSLKQILKLAGINFPQDSGDIAITGITLDSRQVRPGNLFVALYGGNTDGHQFVADAVQRGAAAVVGSKPLPDFGVPYIEVEDGRWALAQVSAAFYNFPARRLTVIGVTGTDGKTTTSNLIYSILRSAGLQAGMISTVNAVIGNESIDTGFHVTTPEAPDIQRYLARMVSAGLTHVILEVTSHGLKQHRVAACEFDIGVVTNVTHEHLDYHGTYEDYRASKARLFTALSQSKQKEHNPPSLAVLNRDDASFDYLSKVTKVARVTYGLGRDADVRAVQVAHNPDGLDFSVIGDNYRFSIKSGLIGEYNVYNCLAAIGATVDGLGIDEEAAQAGIAKTETIPGRMEVIDLGQNFLAIVDFAHTPNALQRALETARSLASGRVIAVFGSAGLRDRAKRRLMAEVSAELADLTVLTAEDPRSESLDAILAEMVAGAESRAGIEGKTFWRIPDRGAALHFALTLAQPGDVVIACGKGHEQSMCFGETEYSWDDRVAMRAALAEYLGIPGPEMPYLPTQEGD